jgi:hypothetical protein
MSKLLLPKPMRLSCFVTFLLVEWGSLVIHFFLQYWINFLWKFTNCHRARF